MPAPGPLQSQAHVCTTTTARTSPGQPCRMIMQGHATHPGLLLDARLTAKAAARTLSCSSRWSSTVAKHDAHLLRLLRLVRRRRRCRIGLGLWRRIVIGSRRDGVVWGMGVNGEDTISGWEGLDASSAFIFSFRTRCQCYSDWFA